MSSNISKISFRHRFLVYLTLSELFISWKSLIGVAPEQIGFTIVSDGAAATSDAAIVYNPGNGKLFFNPNVTTAGLKNSLQKTCSKPFRVIAEIARLTSDNPYRQNALELFSNLRVILKNKQTKNLEETELMMNLSPLYLEQIDIATQKGHAAGEATGIVTGLERGRFEEGKSLIIRQLNRKLGALGSESIEQIDRLNLVQIESLGDALLDFDRSEDLISWLNALS